MRLLPWVLVLPACRDRGDAPHSAPLDSADTADSAVLAERRWAGSVPGQGLGAALALLAGGEVLAGAPWAGPGGIYRLDAGGPTLLATEGAVGALGLALAADGAGWLAAAPLRAAGAGAVVRDGETAQEGQAAELLGAALAVTAGHTLLGARDAVLVDGVRVELPGTPRALAWVAGGWVAGLPQGELALVQAAGALARPAPGDEAGYALCAADLDRDGDEELAVGAPGAGQVWILEAGEGWAEAQRLEGEGRFGHALACAEGELLVGAPLAGPTQRGAVWRVGAELTLPAEPALEGEADWEQLGGAVLLSPGWLWAAGCGDAACAGVVRAAPLP